MIQNILANKKSYLKKFSLSQKGTHLLFSVEWLAMKPNAYKTKNWLSRIYYIYIINLCIHMHLCVSMHTRLCVCVCVCNHNNKKERGKQLESGRIPAGGMKEGSFTVWMKKTERERDLEIFILKAYFKTCFISWLHVFTYKMFLLYFTVTKVQGISLVMWHESAVCRG